MLHGILNINKERGLTSHQVVANLRRILHQKEIGHTGTLDPEATGVLVVGLGQATRSFPFLSENLKVYRAEMILGQATDTQDATGAVIAEDPTLVCSIEEIREEIDHFIGEVAQIPPMFSAVKVKGEKLYDLARRGLVVEREARTINVHHWEVINPQPQYRFQDRVTVEITCSRGTYIRTLIHDLGNALGCGSHMGRLIRLRSGDFRIEDAVTVAEVSELFAQGRLQETLVSLNIALYHLPPLWLVDDDIVKVKNGGKLSFEKYPISVESTGFARVLDRDSRVIAIVELSQTETHAYWQPVKVFQYH